MPSSEYLQIAMWLFFPVIPVIIFVFGAIIGKKNMNGASWVIASACSFGFVLFLFLMSKDANAGEAQSAPPPEVQALGRMAQECQAREASALVQAFTLQARLAAETKRADDAEAKLKSAEPAKP